MNPVDVSRRLIQGRFFSQSSSRPSSPYTNPSAYLYDDMPCQSIDKDGFLPQGQRRHYLFSKLLDVPFNLPYSSLMKIPAAFGEVVYGQLL